ncbi:MAG: vlmJ [Pseudonocardiales bacterium]|nr:vlmJ [Pseudonocardiales bacterium]
MTTAARQLPAHDIALSDVLVIANPAAAAVTGELVSEVERALEPLAGTCRVEWLRSPGDGKRILAENSQAGLVVAVGGDGTVAEVAGTLADNSGHGRVLLTLPAGSGNSTSRNLWGDVEYREILDAIADGGYTTRAIDLMYLQEPDTTVILGASTGFLAQVLINARAVNSSVSGIERYYAGAAGVLESMPDNPTRVTVDGVVLFDGPASSVAVGGGRYRARFFEFLPESILDDGLLDVSTMSALDSDAVTELVPLLLSGQHLGRPEIRYTRGRHVVIESTDGRDLVTEFDGEVWDGARSRLTIDVLPAALCVLVPLVQPCG